MGDFKLVRAFNKLTILDRWMNGFVEQASCLLAAYYPE
jgi:hypothetical protein